VIVHGDFRPQNALIEGDRINALVDWEFAHIGQPVENLALGGVDRSHAPPDAVDVLPELLDASRLGMNWSARH